MLLLCNIERSASSCCSSSVLTSALQQNVIKIPKRNTIIFLAFIFFCPLQCFLVAACILSMFSEKKSPVVFDLQQGLKLQLTYLTTICLETIAFFASSFFVSTRLK